MVPILLLVAGIAASLVMAWLTVKGGSVRPWLFSSHYETGFTDLQARIFQVFGVRDGQNIYVPFGIEAFTYPPAAILLFLPLTVMTQTTAFFSWTALTILCLAAAYFVGIRAVRRRGIVADMAAAVWAAVLSVAVFPPMSQTLAWGQTGTILLLLVTADVLAVRGRSQGVLVGLATALKLYPGIIIVFWLCRRQWRAAATAIGTGVLATAVAWLLWPASASTFFFHVLLQGSETSHFDSGSGLDRSASVSSFFLRATFLPRGAAVALGVVVSLLVLIAGITAAVRLSRAGNRMLPLVTLLCVSVMISPVTWDHYFTFAPLLILVIVEVGWSTTGRLSLAALALFTVPWFIFRQPFVVGSQVFQLPFGQAALALISRNALFVAGMLILGAAVVQARRTQKPQVIASIRSSATRADAATPASTTI